MSPSETADPAPRANRGRTLLFWLVLAATPLALLALAEGAARLVAGSAVAADARLNLVDVPSFFRRVRAQGRDFWQVSHPEAYRGRQVRFAAEKPADTLRIFCLGGSASAGWPHPPSEIYSVYLERALARAYPERRVEVLNVSAHAYASYRVRLIFERVLDFEPDALVLYTGNNEFLERRAYLRRWPVIERLANAASHLVLYRLLRSSLAAALYPETVLRAGQREHVATGLHAKLSRSAVRLRSDPVQFEGVLSHYAATVEAMLSEAGGRGVPVVLVTVPVNLRDWHPNVSHHALTGPALEMWRTAFDGGRGALLAGRPDEAVARLHEAATLEPEHAETHFQLARALEAAGRHAAAFDAYRLAADLDYNPFRALSRQNAALRELAARRPHVVLADAEAAFRSAAAPRAPGFDLFLDYVHPTEAGNVLLAQSVFDATLGAGLLGSPRGESTFRYAETARERGYDEDRDVRLQATLLALFVTMHQYEGAVAKARALAADGHDDAPLVNVVLEVFAPWLELERRRLTGEPVDPGEWARAQAALRRYYAQQTAAAARAS